MQKKTTLGVLTGNSSLPRCLSSKLNELINTPINCIHRDLILLQSLLSRIRIMDKQMCVNISPQSLNLFSTFPVNRWTLTLM